MDPPFYKKVSFLPNILIRFQRFFEGKNVGFKSNIDSGLHKILEFLGGNLGFYSENRSMVPGYICCDIFKERMVA